MALELMMHPNEVPSGPLELVLALQDLLLPVAEGNRLDEQMYREVRERLMKLPQFDKFPAFIRHSRGHDQVWGNLKSHASGSGSWAKRRQYVYDSLAPMIAEMERRDTQPLDEAVSDSLANFDTQAAQQAWSRALARREEDPEGAITSARTLLESTCKHILDEAGEAYENNDLPKLYKRVSELLNLAPSQHTEETFRAILGGCHSVVQNLGTLRNRMGDAHGQGKNPVRPAKRHAGLAVNLAGAMSVFLLETWEVRR
ncbi:abortive infection family protein [Ahrensia marina]|uniref:abortive infection family protein n=1 Tax=Ahrensia marina TaxID=1514904 RepID=UPI0035CFA4F2